MATRSFQFDGAARTRRRDFIHPAALISFAEKLETWATRISCVVAGASGAGLVYWYITRALP